MSESMARPAMLIVRRSIVDQLAASVAFRMMCTRPARVISTPMPRATSRMLCGKRKTWAEAPPSTCISSYGLPSTSTRIIDGGKAPGIAAEARRMVRQSSSAFGSPLAATAPRFQITGWRASKFVVPTRRMRPFVASGPVKAMAVASGLLAQRSRWGCRPHSCFTMFLSPPSVAPNRPARHPCATDITYIPGGAPIQRTPLANSLSWMKRQPARSAAPRSSLAPEMPRMLPTIT